MENSNPIPEGYMQNAVGHLVPKSMIKDIDIFRDDLVCDLVQEAKTVRVVLADFKERAFSQLAEFIELSATEYDKTLGGEKGNVTLLSYDGKHKVLRAIAEHFVFDERLQIAKSLIDECLNEWTNSSGPELKVLVNDAFQVDREGNVNAKRILGLRKHNIENDRWQKAMTAINDSLTVAGSCSYIRIYERVGTTDKWKQLPLDLAGV